MALWNQSAIAPTVKASIRGHCGFTQRTLGAIVLKHRISLLMSSPASSAIPVLSTEGDGTEAQFMHCIKCCTIEYNQRLSENCCFKTTGRECVFKEDPFDLLQHPIVILAAGDKREDFKVALHPAAGTEDAKKINLQAEPKAWRTFVVDVIIKGSLGLDVNIVDNNLLVVTAVHDGLTIAHWNAKMRDLIRKPSDQVMVGDLILRRCGGQPDLAEPAAFADGARCWFPVRRLIEAADKGVRSEREEFLNELSPRMAEHLKFL